MFSEEKKQISSASFFQTKKKKIDKKRSQPLPQCCNHKQACSQQYISKINLIRRRKKIVCGARSLQDKADSDITRSKIKKNMSLVTATYFVEQRAKRKPDGSRSRDKSQDP
ncbi:unnamed protein product [Musa hybrid cultivar]